MGFWYFTEKKDADDGQVKSLSKEAIFLPEVGWTYYDAGYFNRTNFDNCRTIGGPNPDEPCILPFVYWKKEFDKCSTQIQDSDGIFGDSEPWCPTQIAGIDGDAKKLTAWGYCGAGCPIEADAWRDDDATFIVKYSDDETWKMTAFLIMISTGACLLVIGLLI